jgi:hypothetical protein
MKFMQMFVLTFVAMAIVVFAAFIFYSAYRTHELKQDLDRMPPGAREQFEREHPGVGR